MSSPPTENGAAETPSQPDEPRSLRIEDWLTVVIMALLALITFANVLVRRTRQSDVEYLIDEAGDDGNGEPRP